MRFIFLLLVASLVACGGSELGPGSGRGEDNTSNIHAGSGYSHTGRGEDDTPGAYADSEDGSTGQGGDDASSVDAGSDAGPPDAGVESVTFSRVCVNELADDVRGQFGVQDKASMNMPATFANTFEVASAAEFTAAIDAAAPGDLISIADGTHAWGEVEVGTRERGGNGFEPEERVWIMPANSSGATFDDTRFDVEARHLTFFDLNFVNSGITLRSEGTRVAFSTFTGGDDAVYLHPRNSISVDDVEIDNNLFTGQTSDSIAITTRPFGSDDVFPSPQRTWIHHNRFQDHTAVEYPCIGAGVGWHPFPDDQPAHTLIEYNSFDGCTGDDEIIELKHRGAWIRYNLIENSGRGHLSGRMTGNAHYTGNVHLGGSSHGFRVFGNDNVGVFNLMQTRRSITTSPTVASDHPNIDYNYLAMVDHLYTMNVFWNASVWMNVQSTGEENIDLSRGNVIRDNFWLGSDLDYSDISGNIPYQVWLENNPQGAFPGDNWVMNDAGNNCYDSAVGTADFSPVVIEGDWSPTHRGEKSPDVVHRLPFWWFDLLTFEE